MAIQVGHILSSFVTGLTATMQKLSVQLSFTLDDSYTPATLAVRAGTSLMDLQDIRIVTLEKPDGWYTFDVSAEPNEDGDGLYVTSF